MLAQLRNRRGIRGIGVEDVLEHQGQPFERRGQAVQRNRPVLNPVEPPQVVQPRHVIDVMVGEQYGIHPADIIRQTLQPQFGRSIYEQARVGLSDVDAGPGPLVARVGRPADRAIAGNHGHAVRRSRAKDGDCDWLSHVTTIQPCANSASNII
jgi:hypothetical protein